MSEARDAVSGIMKAATDVGSVSIEFFAEMLVIVAVKLGVPKHRLQETVSRCYDVERDNAKLPQ